MCTSCAMMASSVTSPVEVERANVDGVVEAGGVTISVCGRIGRTWASLRLTVAVSMAHIGEKCVDFG